MSTHTHTHTHTDASASETVFTGFALLHRQAARQAACGYGLHVGTVLDRTQYPVPVHRRAPVCLAGRREEVEGRGKTLMTSCVSQRSQSRVNSHVKSVTSSCISLTFQCVSVRACVRACVCVCVRVCVVTASCNLLICHVCHLSRHQICLLCVLSHHLATCSSVRSVTERGRVCGREEEERESEDAREESK